MNQANDELKMPTEFFGKLERNGPIGRPRHR
jgi:hypothetical protein